MGNPASGRSRGGGMPEGSAPELRVELSSLRAEMSALRAELAEDPESWFGVVWDLHAPPKRLLEGATDNAAVAEAA